MTLKNNGNPPHILRLCKRADFLRVRNCGKSVATKSCIIQYAPMQHTPMRMNMQNTHAHMGDSVHFIAVGFTATKKIGKATVRNRAKRRLRAGITDKSLQLKSGYDIVLIARSATVHCSWEKLLTDIKQGLYEAGLISHQ